MYIYIHIHIYVYMYMFMYICTYIYNCVCPNFGQQQQWDKCLGFQDWFLKHKDCMGRPCKSIIKKGPKRSCPSFLDSMCSDYICFILDGILTHTHTHTHTHARTHALTLTHAHTHTLTHTHTQHILTYTFLYTYTLTLTK